MKRTDLTVEEALEQASRLPFAWIRTPEAVTLGENPGQPDLTDLLEARFFDETREIRLFRRGNTLEAASTCRDETDQTILDTYALENQSKFGGSLQVLRYLEPDEDGQMQITATCLAGWKEGTGHDGR